MDEPRLERPAAPAMEHCPAPLGLRRCRNRRSSPDTRSPDLLDESYLQMTSLP